MKLFRLFVSGEPKAQQRPRFSTKSGFVKAYDPEDSRNAKATIGMMARAEMGDEPPMEGDLLLQLTVRRNPPASWSNKRRKAALGTGVRQKPDLDNHIKLVLDALNGVVFKDDKEITAIVARKVWTDRTPGMSIIVTELEAEEAWSEGQKGE